jgi:hypothetical protein
MISWACGRSEKGKTCVEMRLLSQLADELRSERRGGPRVHHVGFGGELLAATVGAGRRIGGRRPPAGPPAARSSIGQKRFAAIAQYQTGKGTPKTRWREMHQSQEILHPLPVAVLHVRRDATDLLARGQQLVLVVEHADEPLRAHDVLDRRVAALVDAHGLRGRALAPAARRARAAAIDDLLRGLRRWAGRQTGRRRPSSAPARSMASTQRQVVRAPPGHVRCVAEGAAHHHAGALLGIGAGIGQHGHRWPERAAPWRCGRQDGHGARRPDAQTRPRRPAAARGAWWRWAGRRRRPG